MSRFPDGVALIEQFRTNRNVLLPHCMGLRNFSPISLFLPPIETIT